MKRIPLSEVEKIAQLARLEFTKQDLEKFQSELSSILGYVDIIQKADTDGIEPSAQVTGLVDIIRKDEKVASELNRDELFSNTPDKKEGYIKVKSVLE